MTKKIFSVILIILVLTSSISLPVSAFTPTSFEVRAESAVLISLDTGETLYEKNTDERRYPASLTKVMTAMLLIENSNDLDNDIITVSENVVNSMLGTGLVIANLKSGEQVSVRNMLHMLLISSAADASVAIAEYVSGSESAFVELMNERAKELGMNSTHFVNTHGAHDPDHYTTAGDIAILAKYALKNSTFADVVSKARYTVPATNLSGERYLSTTNFLIDPAVPRYYYKYATGVKTGFTDEAGRCFIGCASRDGYKYMCVILKSPVYDEKGRMVRYEFEDAKNLFQWAFDDFMYKTVLKSGEIVGEAKVTLARNTDYVTVAAKDEIATVLPKNADLSTVEYKLKLDKKSFEATVKKGQKLGTADVMYAGEVIGTTDVLATSTVERSMLLSFFNSVKKVFVHPITKTILILILIGIIAFIASVKYLNRGRKKKKPGRGEVIVRKNREDKRDR